MLNWLKNAVGWVGNKLDDFKNWVVGLVSVVYSYFDGWINWLIGFINQVWQALQVGIQWLWGLIKYLGDQIAYWVPRIYRDIQNWVVGIWHDLYKYIQDVWQWASRLIAYLKTYIDNMVNSLANWVIKNIWDPLYNSIAGLARWIATKGEFVYGVITNPERLAQILGRYILGAWLGLGRRYAGTFARWMLHNMISASHEIGGILEDFIAAII